MVLQVSIQKMSKYVLLFFFLIFFFMVVLANLVNPLHKEQNKGKVYEYF